MYFRSRGIAGLCSLAGAIWIAAASAGYSQVNPSLIASPSVAAAGGGSFYTYREPEVRLSVGMHGPSEAPQDCETICRATGASAKSYCQATYEPSAENCYAAGGVAAGQASKAADALCTATFKSKLLAKGCAVAAGAAAAKATVAACKHACSIVGAGAYGSCMCGCTPAGCGE